MQVEEEPLVFHCQRERLVGILHSATAESGRALLIVVGGPQYRIGSHRQFVLLARHLALRGTPVLRFDYRGMGDSDGEPRSFEVVSEDIAAAVDLLCARMPRLREIVIWGLCDGASAALLYAPTDPRVSALVLVNPWIRTDLGRARAELRHYYGRKFFDWRSWQDFFKSDKSLLEVLQSVLATARAALVPDRSDRSNPENSQLPLPRRLAYALERYRGRVLVVLSGDDLTAREFADVTASSRQWRRLLRRRSTRVRQLAGADHTFSRRIWQDTVAEWTHEWINAQ